MILTHLTNTKIMQLEWRCDWVTHLYRVDRTESPLSEALFPSLRTILGVLEEVQQIPKKQQSNWTQCLICMYSRTYSFFFQFNRANIFDDDNQLNLEQFVFRAKVDTCVSFPLL